MSSVSYYDDVINSLDVIERIEELRQVIHECAECGEEVDWDADPKCACDSGEGEPPTITADDEDRREFAALVALEGEACGAADWAYGETLIRDSYFEEYAQQLAVDTGLLDTAMTWPLRCIDWEQAARELKHDYTPVEFDGVTYWIRD